MSGSHLCLPINETVISKTEIQCSVSQFLNSYCISVRDLFISSIGLPILLQGNMGTDLGNTEIAHRHLHVEIGTEAAQFPGKGIFLAVCDSSPGVVLYTLNKMSATYVIKLGLAPISYPPGKQSYPLRLCTDRISTREIQIIQV
jgi:hypothetical protein